MKKLNLSLALLLVSFAASARPTPEMGFVRAPQGLCRLSYHADSAGRGIEAGFKNLDLRPSPNDENCYLQGVDEGKTLAQNDSICRAEFENGKQAGLNASPDTTGTECFSKGLIAGGALLNVAARAGDSSVVGSECVAQYKLGLNDGSKNLPTQYIDSPRGAACYSAGFYDASQLGN
jgi:hypothetical protein